MANLPRLPLGTDQPPTLRLWKMAYPFGFPSISKGWNGLRLLGPSQSWNPNFFNAGRWKGPPVSRGGFAPGASTGRPERVRGLVGCGLETAPHAKPPPAWQPIRTQHVSASPVNPEVCGGSSRWPGRRGGGIWQLGLLARGAPWQGRCSGGAVRGGGSPCARPREACCSGVA